MKRFFAFIAGIALTGTVMAAEPFVMVGAGIHSTDHELSALGESVSVKDQGLVFDGRVGLDEGPASVYAGYKHNTYDDGLRGNTIGIGAMFGGVGNTYLHGFIGQGWLTSDDIVDMDGAVFQLGVGGQLAENAVIELNWQRSTLDQHFDEIGRVDLESDALVLSVHAVIR